MSASPIESKPGELSSPPFGPLPRRATIGDPVYENRQRRKAAVVACERCRRRKIRCDGLQPCATCARFNVRCAKPEQARDRSGSNAEHAALADRVKLLEARLAAVSAGEPQFPDAMQAGPSNRPTPPSLHVDTNFNMDDIPRSWSYDSGMQDELSMTDDLVSASLSVPTISITGPNGSMPSSPIAMSPSPSLFSGTSRASSPEPFSATALDFGGPSGSSMLAPVPNGNMRTPPLAQWADVYARNEMLRTPGSGHGWISRRSSVSSFGGLGEAACQINIDVPNSPVADWNMQSPFDMQMSGQDVQLSLPDPTPAKAQAKALTDGVFNQRQLPFDRTAFALCFEAVYDIPAVDGLPSAAYTALSTYTPYSIRMAKCFVFLTLSISMKLFGGAGVETAGIDSCYMIAMQQMQTIDFWTEAGSQEVASLLSILGDVSRS